MMQVLAMWLDEPFPLVNCTAHVFEPLAWDERTYRCIRCGRCAVDRPDTPETVNIVNTRLIG